MERVPTSCVTQQLRVRHLDAVDAVGPQPDHLELGVAEEDGLGRAPLLVREHVPVYEEDFRPEGRVTEERRGDEGRQERDVHGGEGVAPGLEHVVRLAVAEEHRPLGLPDDQLRADLELAGPLFGDPVDHLVPVLVHVFDDLCKSHLLPPHPGDQMLAFR